MHMFIRNDHPQNFLVGKVAGRRHVESKTANEVKWSIRERFNPTSEDGGLSHNHVVHFSDSTEQAVTAALRLKVCEEDQIRNFFQKHHFGLTIPHHLPTPAVTRYGHLPISSLRANIWGKGGRLELTSVGDTPHFNALKNKNRDLYDEYLSPRLGGHIKDGQSFERLLQLQKRSKGSNFDEFSPIVVRKTSSGLFLILDGLHRATVAAVRGEKSIFSAVTESGR